MYTSFDWNFTHELFIHPNSPNRHSTLVYRNFLDLKLVDQNGMCTT